jgi:hypothetical protein
MGKKIFRLALTAILLLNFSAVLAQDYAETALLFGRTRPAGSARIQALGGSQTALGGDYSSALSNPAGLGLFNRSEFTFSAGLTSRNTFSNYLDNRTEDNRTVFNIPGISLVWHSPKDKGGFLGGSFGVSLSRTNDFNQSTLYSGRNENNSIVDYFIDQAFGSTTTQFDEDAVNYNTPTGLAYFNFLIGAKSILPDPGPDDEYFTDVGYPDQQEEILVKGATNQWSFSYGGNVKDKFFFGAGVGISSLRYKSQKIFTEYYDNPEIIEMMQLTENLEIRGSGINATLGAIARPVDFIQVGVSYTTPTFYGITETYDAAMGSRWNNFDYYGDGEEILGDNTNNPIETDLVTSDYNLTIPSRVSVGVALLSEFGFLSGDIELTNPAKTKYTSDTPGISYSDDNENIRSIYQPVVNYRVGAEFRYDIWRVRGGFGIQSNSYRGNEADNTMTSLTGGAGVRLKKFYIDFALVHSASKKYGYQPYTFFDGSGPIVSLKQKITTGMITAGFTF